MTKCENCGKEVQHEGNDCSYELSWHPIPSAYASCVFCNMVCLRDWVIKKCPLDITKLLREKGVL